MATAISVATDVRLSWVRTATNEPLDLWVLSARFFDTGGVILKFARWLAADRIRFIVVLRFLGLRIGRLCT